MARHTLSTDERWRIIEIGKWQGVNSLLMRDGEQLKWEMARHTLSTDERWRIIEIGKWQGVNSLLMREMVNN